VTWAKRRPGQSANDYGAKHQKLRKALLPQAYGQPCSRCGNPMLPGQELHLHHNDSGIGYLGWSHAACNLRAAARTARRKQLARKIVSGRRDDSDRW
jgi:hypothetical protein